MARIPPLKGSHARNRKPPAGLGPASSVPPSAAARSAIPAIPVRDGLRREFRHSTASLTYLATPRRNRVLAATAIASGSAGIVFGLVGYVIAVGVGLIFVEARGCQLAVSDATLARYGAGHLVAAGLLAAAGAGVGSLVRSQLAAVIGVFVWAIVIESLLGALFNSVQPYLPYTAATTLAGSSLGGGAFGPAHDAATTATALPFAAATALLAGVAIVASVAASWTTVPRDVT
jgi:hypothetical protein